MPRCRNGAQCIAHVEVRGQGAHHQPDRAQDHEFLKQAKAMEDGHGNKRTHAQVVETQRPKRVVGHKKSAGPWRVLQVVT